MKPLTQDHGVVIAAGTVRGTQSLVHTLERCWRKPGWTALEVLWRWVFGVPTLFLLWFEGIRIVQKTPLDITALKSMTIQDQMGAAEILARTMGALIPPTLRTLLWLAPLLIVFWVVISSVGRTLVLRRVDGRLHSRTGTLMVLQSLRILALLATFAGWFLCLRWASKVTITGPLGTGSEPNLVGYFSLAIVTTLMFFSSWAVASWGLTVAPLLAMLRDQGMKKSLAGAFHLGPLKSKLMEINLVMCIVKLALIVLGLVFSSTPMAFESVMTQTYLRSWWVAVALVYFVASDFFHVARLVAYLELWQAYEGNEGLG